jgi:hypothetical protein
MQCTHHLVEKQLAELHLNQLSCMFEIGDLIKRCYIQVVHFSVLRGKELNFNMNIHVTLLKLVTNQLCCSMQVLHSSLEVKGAAPQSDHLSCMSGSCST